jgi:ATP-binding cassette, subfamily B, bacterial PglK
VIEYFKKVFYLLPKGDKYRVVGLLGLMFVAAIIEVAGIGMIPAFVAIVADPARVMGYEPISGLLDRLGINTSQEMLVWGGAALVLVFFFKNLYLTFYFYVEARFAYSRYYRLAHRLMSSYMQAPYTFHLQRNTADLLRNSSSEVRLLIQQVIKPCLVMTKEVVMSLSIVAFLLFMEPVITLIVMLLLGSGVSGFLMLTQRRVKGYGKEEQEHRRGLIKALNQGVGGIKDARVLNREAEFIEKFRYAASRSAQMLTKKFFLSKIPKPIVETIAVAGIMIIAILMVAQGRPVTSIIPVLTLFVMATVRLLPAIQQVTKSMTKLRYNIVVVDPIYNDIVELAEYRERFLADRENEGRLELKERITIRDLHYSYPGSDEQALRGVSLEIPKGASIAFTGPSGAGKTTIVDLILGLLDPVKGEIMVDGKNIQDNLSSWQRNIGYIPQFIYLCDETLRSNVAFGVPDNEVDEEAVWQALKLAQLDDFVRRLPEGLDTIIGERGVRLSGGQRQRIGIARALYHNPQVLVMDEATSALDNVTEKQIISALEGLKGDRTVITIAHRLTTVMNCDRIYFMQDGLIESAGTYGELITKSDSFRVLADAN